MLQEYFVKPATVDRLHASWIADQIETYVSWLADHSYSTSCVLSRVPIVYAFGEFARANGAQSVDQLHSHVEVFVAERVARVQARTGSGRPMAKEVRGPVEQFLSVVLEGFEPSGRPHPAVPFADVAPSFFDYLVTERGLPPRVGEQLPTLPVAVRCLPAADRRRIDQRAVTDDLVRLHRGPRGQWAGQELGA